MAKLTNLIGDETYDIIDAQTGNWVTQGIQGADAMAEEWGDGDEAWPAGEEVFSGKPIDVAA